jgi:hypothetical protein
LSLSTQGHVGPIPASADGPTQPIRLGRDSSIAAQDTHARYQEAVYRGNVFTATATSVTLPISGSTVAPAGFILTNPAASGKDIVLLECIVAPSGSALSGFSTVVLSAVNNPVAAAVVHTTPLTIRNAFLGTPGSSIAFADSQATLPAAPFILRSFPGSIIVASGSYAPLKDEIAGAIILGQGTAVSIQSMANVGLICNITMTWEEIPI